MTITETNLTTGEVTVRDLTPDEAAQRDKDAVEHAARKQADDTIHGNRSTLTDRAAQALAANRVYLGLASPSAAQQRTQLDRLTRQHNALIRLVLGLLDGTD